MLERWNLIRDNVSRVIKDNLSLDPQQHQHQHQYRRRRRCCRWWWRGWHRGWCWRERLLLLMFVCGGIYVACLWFRSGTSALGSGTGTKRSPLMFPGDTLHHTTLPRYRGLNEDQVELNGILRMRKRQKLLSDFCTSYSDDDSSESADNFNFRTNILVSRHRPLLYCPVGKMASTFVTRFLVAAEETHPVESPYVISPQKAVRMRSKRTGNNILFAPLSSMVEAASVKERQLLGSVRRVIFVRCPFHRLWSAYVDKLLFPNPFYWKTWGYPAMNKLNATGNPFHESGAHKAAGDLSLMECGQSVSFSQFISFALNHLQKQDTHVRPVARECAPCDVNYDIIGHVETLTSDVLYLTSVLRLNNSTLTLVDWEEEYANDAIKEGVKNVFLDWVSKIRECMKVGEAVRRLWHVLQIRGIISDKIKFPHTLAEDSVTSTAVETALLKARSESAGLKEVLEQQRHAASWSAYQTVSQKLKSRIRQVYAADFHMFGFDEKQYL